MRKSIAVIMASALISAASFSAAAQTAPITAQPMRVAQDQGNNQNNSSGGVYNPQNGGQGQSGAQGQSGGSSSGGASTSGGATSGGATSGGATSPAPAPEAAPPEAPAPGPEAGPVAAAAVPFNPFIVGGVVAAGVIICAIVCFGKSSTSTSTH
jgi:hypothetical protein